MAHEIAQVLCLVLMSHNCYPLQSLNLVWFRCLGYITTVLGYLSKPHFDRWSQLFWLHCLSEFVSPFNPFSAKYEPLWAEQGRYQNNISHWNTHFPPVRVYLFSWDLVQCPSWCESARSWSMRGTFSCPAFRRHSRQSDPSDLHFVGKRSIKKGKCKDKLFRCNSISKQLPRS